MKQTATILIFIALLFTQTVFAQKDSLSMSRKSSFHLNAGTTFFGSKQFSGNTFFLNPEFQQPLTKRLSIHAGAVVSSMQFFQTNGIQAFRPYSSASVYAAGSFILNDTWTLYGGVIHTKPMTLSSSDIPFNSSTTLFGGFDYKLSNSSTIGVRFSYSKDPYPLLLHPMGGNSAHSSFSGYPGSSLWGW